MSAIPHLIEIGLQHSTLHPETDLLEHQQFEIFDDLTEAEAEYVKNQYAGFLLQTKANLEELRNPTVDLPKP